MASTTQQVTVSRTIYKTMVTVFNEAGEVVRHLALYRSDPGPLSADNVFLSATLIEPTNAAGSSGIPSEVRIGLGDGTTVVWDGRTDAGNFVQNGQYLVELASQTGPGAQTVITREVSVEDVSARAGAGQVAAWPNFLRTGSMTAVFHTNSALNLTLRVSVYTVAGELVGRVEGDNAAAPPAWNAAGKASGLYLAVVEERDPNGGILSRQVVKVMVVH